jgi:hypothetical protein
MRHGLHDAPECLSVFLSFALLGVLPVMRWQGGGGLSAMVFMKAMYGHSRLPCRYRFLFCLESSNVYHYTLNLNV